ncbi:deoxyribodipyrimidine photo-lyase [Alienimonas californiensis]|uniref:Deoxyribodipyrimidine photo-lyase n=1 Tax=Alienimonas californiensis TaxID=2527989 RepID=A0A517P4T4_9PLAN|nr:deoxyribodipyrimidine photo-lyase [Alienimonas californiensis]QDT14371.1 Deoxyribodipyrimidine photo-lyase [Alienimonas californiensis]
MATQLIEPARVRKLTDAAPRPGDYVLYWMQASQRAEHNPALEYAARQANELKLPLLVGFGLTDDYPGANLRHYRFMLEGLAEVEASLARRGIGFTLRHDDPDRTALALAEDAAAVVVDRGYLRLQKQWRQTVAESLKGECAFTQVEGDVVVPVELASDKREYAARTIRPKILKHRDRFLVELKPTPLDRDAGGLSIPDGLDLSDVPALCDSLTLDRSVGPVSQFFEGGTTAAKTRLRSLLDGGFRNYSAHRNQPQTDDLSYLSMALHFGQISPVEAVLMTLERFPEGENTEDFLEEAIVRRELTHNYVHYTPRDYDSYSALPDWARTTLAEHSGDEREHVYTREELENAATHDDYWNAAMREMKHTGYMHNYMRMYWGKKILEWTNTPEYGNRITREINDKYFLDGRDPNSYANVNWVYGLHDRPWTERPVFGKTRYMNANGLRRKCDIDGYVEKVDRLVERAEG